MKLKSFATFHTETGKPLLLHNLTICEDEEYCILIDNEKYKGKCWHMRMRNGKLFISDSNMPEILDEIRVKGYKKV